MRLRFSHSFLFLLFLCPQVWAEHRPEAKGSDKTKDRPVQDPQMLGFAATAREILRAPCHRPPASTALAEKHVRDATEADKSDLVSKAYERLTRQVEGAPRVPTPTGCEDDPTELCKVKSIFGKTLGPKLLYLLMRYGLNGSHYAVPHAEAYTEEEIDRVLVAIQDYPPYKFPIPGKENIKIARFKKNHTMAAVAATGIPPSSVLGVTIENGNAVYLFDSWERGSPVLKQYAVAHELAHVVGAMNQLDRSPEWLAIGGWKDGGDYYSGPKWIFDESKTRQFPSAYGTTNPFEDFAESVMAYRYHGRELRLKSPERFDYMKEVVFHGVAFTSEQTCELTRTFEYQIAKLARESAGEIKGDTWAKNAALMEDIYKECHAAVGKVYQSPDFAKNEELSKCISKKLELEVSFGFLPKLDLQYPKQVEENVRHSFPRVIDAKEPITFSETQLEPVAKEMVARFTKELPEFFSGPLAGYSTGHTPTKPTDEEYCEGAWKRFTDYNQKRDPSLFTALKPTFMETCLGILKDKLNGERSLSKEDFEYQLIPEVKAAKLKSNAENIQNFVKLAADLDKDPEALFTHRAVSECILLFDDTRFNSASVTKLKECLLSHLLYHAPPLKDLNLDEAQFKATLDKVGDRVTDVYFTAMAQRIVATLRRYAQEQGFRRNSAQDIASAVRAQWASDLEFLGVSDRYVSDQVSILVTETLDQLVAQGKDVNALDADEMLKALKSQMNKVKP